MLLIQFGTMIVDRALYLKKSLLGKCVFQVVLVFGIHFWMFFILPGVTERYLTGYYQLCQDLVSLCRIEIFVNFASFVSFSPLAPQEIQPESCRSALVFCEVYLLRPVSLPDQMWLPEPHPRQLPYKELQLHKPLSLPRVRLWLTDFCIYIFKVI